MNQIAKFNNPTMSSLEAEELTNRIIDGLADEATAYKHGMQLLCLCGKPLRSFNIGDVEKMTREEIEAFLDSVKEAKDFARTAEHLFSKYHVVKLAAKGMWESLFYAEAGLIPLLICGNAKPKSRQTSSCTYIIKNPLSGLIKIGRTCDLKMRMQALQCGAGVPLDVLAVIPGDIEKSLHSKFSKYQVHGEWFSDSDGKIANYAEVFGEVSA